jgi:glycosyltransferase involved in cell wall biosynthesis
MDNLDKKLKVILINYRYFISGGPERYMFNIKSILENNGHKVVPFSVKHKKNEASDFEDYFLGEIGSGEEVYGNEYKRNFRNIFKIISRIVYSFEAQRKLKKLIKDVKPDIIYVLQFQNKISSSVIQASYKAKIPVVQRISDFGHICIDGHFYNYKCGRICEKCLRKSKINAIVDKCGHNSYFVSATKVLALKVIDFLKIRKKINMFVIPAQFTVSKFIEFGIPKEKIVHIPTFFNSESSSIKNIDYQDFFLYFGRIDPDKGLLTLIKSFVNTSYRLIIIGFSIDGYDSFLKDYLKEKNHNITFLGKLDFSAIVPYLETCLCTICPSEWYDNMPNSVLESFAYEKPVIASNLGSLNELVVEKVNGLHFEAGNCDSLRNVIEFMANNRDEVIRMGKNASLKLKNEFSPDLHYDRLIKVFENVITTQQK